MGCCLSKRNNIIIIKANEEVFQDSKLNNKRSFSINSLDFQRQKIGKNNISFLTLFSNDISNEIIRTNYTSEDNNYHNNKTFKEILEYF